MPLHLDASLLEEDATAFECSTVIAANAAAERLAAASKPPLPIPAGLAVRAAGRFFCERCQLKFDSAEALQVVDRAYVALARTLEACNACGSIHA